MDVRQTEAIRNANGVPKGAPFLDGHFPDNPIVPGAILLGYAANALRERGLEIESVLRMKFQRPLLPEVPFDIEITGGATATGLVWRSGDVVIAQARVKLRTHGG